MDQVAEQSPDLPAREVWRDWSARRTLTRRQRIALAALLAVAIIGAVVDALVAATVVTAMMVLVFSATAVHRVRAIFVGWRAWQSPREPAPPLADDELPPFTVLVALYREANVVPALLDALASLDYPAAELDVLLLVEADDPETAAACRTHARPGWQMLVVPEGVPKTKPRALNHGLAHARGELLTIFDAEDRPERDQLRRAAAELARAPAELVCLQARLDFYNERRNLLTKLFTVDYATHFALYLEGLARMHRALPLGGTSTHFRTAAIREVGGWDAWNVTEDCELGMRLAAAGYRAGTLDSATWEEAVGRPRPWIRQRSRWIKGFAQTGLVMLRRPIAAARAMGARRYLAALAGAAGTPIVLMAQLLFWTVFWVYVALEVADVEPTVVDDLFPEPFLSIAAVTMLAGNFAVLLGHMSAVYQQRRYELVRVALALPVYWTLASIAAWKGVLQLIRRPHFWEKTTHGVGEASPATEPDAPAVPALTGGE